jgi:hypothetical protein
LGLLFRVWGFSFVVGLMEEGEKEEKEDNIYFVG